MDKNRSMMAPGSPGGYPGVVAIDYGFFTNSFVIFMSGRSAMAAMSAVAEQMQCNEASEKSHPNPVFQNPVHIVLLR
jgi:hypothetical protein